MLFLVDISKQEYNPESDLRAAITSFRTAYVSASLNNLLAPINNAFQVKMINYAQRSNNCGCIRTQKILLRVPQFAGQNMNRSVSPVLCPFILSKMT